MRDWFVRMSLWLGVLGLGGGVSCVGEVGRACQEEADCKNSAPAVYCRLRTGDTHKTCQTTLCQPGASETCSASGRSNYPCQQGFRFCNDFGVWSSCLGEIGPQVEICDLQDNDCDGLVDNVQGGTCTCSTPGTKRPCYSGRIAAGQQQPTPPCQAGVQYCEVVGEGVFVWGSCLGQVLPQPEGCDGIDNDCDGKIDDHASCKACKPDCSGAQRCVDGTCRADCPSPFIRCGEICVQPNDDTKHCGKCDKACSLGSLCQGGACVCPMGRKTCDGECVDTTQDNKHCGKCGKACAQNQICESGLCRCPANLTPCGEECVDITQSSAHCGACGASCPQGQLCQQGKCVTEACSALRMLCNGTCIDPQTSNQHCGGCGKTCATGQNCTNGRCGGCSAGLSDCAGDCVDTKSSPQHCGSCKTVCAPSSLCKDGVCVAAAVTTLAGIPPYLDGSGISARFHQPRRLLFSPKGDLIVSDHENHRIRKVDSVGKVTTLAGSGIAGAKDGSALSAQFKFPDGMAYDDQGNLYIADSGNHVVRKIDAIGNVSRFAGTGTSGRNNGSPSQAQFSQPSGIVFDGATKTFYVAERGNHTIRKIDLAGAVSTLTGTGSAGNTDGGPTVAQFNQPTGLVVVSSSLYVVDSENHRIRHVTLSNGSTSTLVGTAGKGASDGAVTSAQFNKPFEIVAAGPLFYITDQGNHVFRIFQGSLVTTHSTKIFDPQGIASNDKGLYIASQSKNLIHHISPSGGADQPFVGSELHGYTDGSALSARFNQPYAIALARNGDIHIADRGNHVIRRINASNIVSTIAGTPKQAGSNDGLASSAKFSAPSGLAFDVSGNLYIADTDNHCIRKLDSTNNISTQAGKCGSMGFGNGSGAQVLFNRPHGIATDSKGNIFVADSDNYRIRKIEPSGVVSTVAGDGYSGYQDGPPDQARFYEPLGIAVDKSGVIFVADTRNHRIRKLDPQTGVTTYAGSGDKGHQDGAPLQARFSRPHSLVIDPQGNLWVVDTDNHCIRKIAPTGQVSTIAGRPTLGFYDGRPEDAHFHHPSGIAINAQGGLVIADTENHILRLLQ